MARILIAEDEHDIRVLVQLTLEFSGHEIVSAKDGAEAVELAAKDDFDLILMDVRMPRMNGFDACRRLKTMGRTRDVPVVFLSAKGQDAEVEAGLDLGAIQYILKPFAPEELAREVGQLLDGAAK